MNGATRHQGCTQAHSHTAAAAPHKSSKAQRLARQHVQAPYKPPYESSNNGRASQNGNGQAPPADVGASVPQPPSAPPPPPQPAQLEQMQEQMARMQAMMEAQQAQNALLQQQLALLLSTAQQNMGATSALTQPIVAAAPDTPAATPVATSAAQQLTPALPATQPAAASQAAPLQASKNGTAGAAANAPAPSVAPPSAAAQQPAATAGLPSPQTVNSNGAAAAKPPAAAAAAANGTAASKPPAGPTAAANGVAIKTQSESSTVVATSTKVYVARSRTGRIVRLPVETPGMSQDILYAALTSSGVPENGNTPKAAHELQVTDMRHHSPEPARDDTAEADTAAATTAAAAADAAAAAAGGQRAGSPGGDSNGDLRSVQERIEAMMAQQALIIQRLQATGVAASVDVSLAASNGTAATAPAPAAVAAVSAQPAAAAAPAAAPATEAPSAAEPAAVQEPAAQAAPVPAAAAAVAAAAPQVPLLRPQPQPLLARPTPPAQPAPASSQTRPTAAPAAKQPSPAASRRRGTPGQGRYEGGGSEARRTTLKGEARTGKHVRIINARTWSDVRRLATQEQHTLDTFHAAALLGALPRLIADRLPLPPLVPLAAGGDAAAGSASADLDAATALDPELAEVRAAADELATLLTLHLGQLSTTSLSEVVEAVGELRAVPKTTWLGMAAGAVERATPRMSISEVAASAAGLATLGLQPNAKWLTRFWSVTQGHLKAQRADLADLAKLAFAVTDLSRHAGKSVEQLAPAGWLEQWRAAMLAAVQQAGEEGAIVTAAPPAAAAVALLLAAEQLGSQPPAEEALQMLRRCCRRPLAAAKPTDAPSQPTYVFKDVSGVRLAQLAPTLVSLGVRPDEELLQSYVQALWDQMYQLTPALAVRAFTAVSSWTDQLPEGLLAKVLAQSTAHVTGQTSAAAAALPKGPGGRVVLPGALQTLSTQQMAQFVIQLQRSVQASQAAGSLNASHLRALQLHLSALPFKDLTPTDVIQMVAAVSSLVTAVAAASPADEPVSTSLSSATPHTAVVEQALLFAAYKNLRQQLEAISPDSFAALCRAVVPTGQVDMEFIEAYLTQYVVDPPQSPPPQALVTIMEGLGALGPTMRPRASVLGPVIARCSLAIRHLPFSALLSMLDTMAALRLQPKDTQGVRTTTQQGIPTPTEFIEELLQPLQNQLQTLDVQALVRLTGALAATRHCPNPAVIVALVAACQQQRAQATVNQLVALLSQLSVVKAFVLERGGEGDVAAAEDVQTCCNDCIAQIGEGVAALNLADLTKIMTALADSAAAAAGGALSAAEADQSTLVFADAVMAASEPRLRQAAREPPRSQTALLAPRLASALARVHAVATPTWLEALQNATLTTLPVAREEEVAALSWAVGKLVARRRLTQATTTPTPITTTITSTLASEQSVDEVVLPAWHAALTKRVTQQPLGQNDAYALPDLARMLWGCATLGITPRQGLLNSFANKSMDRVSSLPHQLALESAWASAACGQTLGSKWVNQWAVAVQGDRIARLDSHTLLCVIWALGYHCLGVHHATPAPGQPPKPAGTTARVSPTLHIATTPPPEYILTQVTSRLATLLGAKGKQTAAFTATQVVDMSAALASLGYTPSAETARSIARASVDTHTSADTQTEGLAAADLVSVLWTQARFQSSPSTRWLSGVLTQLEPRLAELSPVQLSRLLWALATLPRTPLPTTFVPTCVELLSREPPAPAPEPATIEGAPNTPLPGTAADTTAVAEANSPRGGVPTQQSDASAVSNTVAAAAAVAVPETLEQAIAQLEGSSMAATPTPAARTAPTRGPRVAVSKRERRRALAGKGKASAATQQDTTRAKGCGIAGLLPGDLVDCVWALARLGVAVPQAWWDLLPARLINRMNLLTAPQVSALLWACAATQHSLPAELANDLSKAAATRFGSVPPAELSDLVFSFARLDLQLPPAFAAASIRRLQSSMATLAPPQLARMLWSFAKSGYTFLPQQLDAYQARVLSCVSSMSLEDINLVVQSFPGLGLRPSEKLQQALQQRTAALLAQQSDPTSATLTSQSSASSQSDDDDSLPSTSDESDTTVKTNTTNTDTTTTPQGSALVAGVGTTQQRANTTQAPAVLSDVLPLLTLVTAQQGQQGQQPELAARVLRQLTVPMLQQLSAPVAVSLLDVLTPQTLDAVRPTPEWLAAYIGSLRPGVPSLDVRQMRQALTMLVWFDSLLRHTGGEVVEGTDGEPGMGLVYYGYGSAREGLLGSLVQQVAAKLPLYGPGDVTDVLECVSRLGLALDLGLLKRCVAPLESSVVKLPTQRHIALSEALIQQVKLASDQPWSDRVVRMETLRPLLNTVLRLTHAAAADDRLGADVIALMLTKASEANTLILSHAAENPEEHAALLERTQRGGLSESEWQRRAQAAAVARERRALTPKPRNDALEVLRVRTSSEALRQTCTPHPLLLAESEIEEVAERRSEIANNIRANKEASQDNLEYAEFLEGAPAHATNSVLDGLWLGEMVSCWLAGLKSKQGVSMQAILSGLIAVSNKEILPPSEYGLILDAASDHLHTATVEECTSLAGQLLRCGVTPTEEWLSFYVTALEAALAREMPAGSNAVLTPQATTDLVVALSQWTTARGRNPIAGAVSGLLDRAKALTQRIGGGAGSDDGDSNDGFPVNSRLATLLLRSVEETPIASLPSAADEPPVADGAATLEGAAQTLNGLCLLCAKQANQGLRLEDAWVKQMLTRTLGEARQRVADHPLLTQLAQATQDVSAVTAAVDSALEHREEQGQGYTGGHLLGGTAVCQLLVSLRALNRGLPKELHATVYELLLVSQFDDEDLEQLPLVLAWLYNIKAQTPKHWVGLMSAVTELMHDERQMAVQAELRRVFEARRMGSASGLDPEQLKMLETSIRAQAVESEKRYSGVRSWLSALQ